MVSQYTNFFKYISIIFRVGYLKKIQILLFTGIQYLQIHFYIKFFVHSRNLK